MKKLRVIYVVCADLDKQWPVAATALDPWTAKRAAKLLEERFESRDDPGEEISAAQWTHPILDASMTDDEIMAAMTGPLSKAEIEPSLCLATPWKDSGLLCDGTRHHPPDFHHFVEKLTGPFQWVDPEPREVLGWGPLDLPAAPAPEQIDAGLF